MSKPTTTTAAGPSGEHTAQSVPTTISEAMERARESSRMAELDLRAAIHLSCGDEAECRLLYTLLFDLVERLCPIVQRIDNAAEITKGWA